MMNERKKEWKEERETSNGRKKLKKKEIEYRKEGEKEKRREECMKDFLKYEKM